MIITPSPYLNKLAEGFQDVVNYECSYRRMIVCCNGKTAWVKWIDCKREYTQGVCEISMNSITFPRLSQLRYKINGVYAEELQDGYGGIIDYQENLIKEKLRDYKINNILG